MENKDFREMPLKIGELVEFKVADRGTYVFLMGEVTRRIDEPGKLSLYSVRAQDVIYHRLRKHLTPNQGELFAG